MKKTTLLLLLLLSKLSFSQFNIGLVSVNSNGCDYTISGTYYDSTNTSLTYPLTFSYDSVLTSWKFIVPDNPNTMVNICATAINCPCLTECVTESVYSNILLNMTLCLTVDIKSTFYDNQLIINSPGVLKISIYDISGKLIKSDYSNTINTSDLITGIYIAVIESKGVIKKIKFIK